MHIGHALKSGHEFTIAKRFSGCSTEVEFAYLISFLGTTRGWRHQLDPLSTAWPCGPPPEPEYKPGTSGPVLVEIHQDQKLVFLIDSYV